MTERCEAVEDDGASAPRAVRVVGIGASAGGLESLEQLFSNLPADPGMAFVVVQHLSPDFRSMMSELLSRRSRMPVRVAGDGMVVRPDHVYLLPPRKELAIEDGRLVLTDKEPTHALTLPVDRFFRSLAKDVGSNAVAVVLSGSGSDGSRGIRDVHRNGGLILVESPETAKFDGMPLSALATGLVDHCGSPSELAAVLTGEAKSTGTSDEAADPFATPTLDAILHLLRDRFGIDFSVYKRGTVGRRILRRLGLRKSGDLETYLQDLRRDPDELSGLLQDLLIGVTQFFRDPDAFDVLERRIVPELLDKVPAGEEIRVWVAGCATGEEAYSIGILLAEQLSARGRRPEYKVLATDVHPASLERGSAGFYADEQLEHVSPERRERFFRRRSGGYLVAQELRQRIVFARHDVTRDAPFTRMHLISCRNLLIYLEPAAQKMVISLLHFGLASGGVLFLGSSESAGAYGHEFDPIDEHWRIHRKRRDVRLIDPIRLPLAARAVGTSSRLLAQARPANADAGLLPLYDRLLDRFMPPGFLVDEEQYLVDAFGGAERYLRIGRRRPSTRVLDLLEGDLRAIVAGALQRVFAGSGPVRYGGATVSVSGEDGEPQALTLTVSAEAFTNPKSGARHVLVMLEEARDREPSRPDSDEARPPSAPAPEAPLGEASLDRMKMLESELEYTRQSLQGAVEQQQTSNEELQAANEELVASNEELQSTNEELHSVNEELHTVNGEYQKKIVELRELNDDMRYVLEESDVGTLFLDRELRVRRFTPRMAGLFHLQQGDVGRSVRDFSHELDRPGLLDELEHVLSTGDALEDEVTDRDGTTFFLRVVPYRSTRDGSETSREPGEPDLDRDFGSVGSGRSGRSSAPDGVMVTLTDISALDHARARIYQLSAIVESADAAIIGKDLEGTITSWNRGAERLYGFTAEEVVGRNIKLLAPPEREEEIDRILETIRRGNAVEHIETMRVRKDGRVLHVSVTVSPIHDREGTIVGASAIARDVTPLRRAQVELEEREARIRLLLDSTAEAIYGIDREGLCTFCNPACARMLGYDSADDLIGRRMDDVVWGGNPAARAASESAISSVLRTGRGTHSDGELFHRADGSTFAAEFWSHPIVREGVIEGAVVTFLDITDRRRADEELRAAATRREQFLAMLSHELRTPLAAVLSATRLLRARAGDENASRKARDVIERQSGHMARLLDDLLDVSRITRGGIELRTEDLDLRDSIRAAVEAVSPLFEARGTRLRIDVPEEPLAVRGDGARLQQVVGNLLTNASKYSPPGARVTLIAGREGANVVLRVEDDGNGIEPGLLPHVFELFVQTEQGLDRANGGLGVGLALVRQLVHLHGGEVTARSDGPGRGSEFVVVLPRLERPTFGPRSTRAPEAGECIRVVLVEDQDDARGMLKELLEAEGYTVFEAKDGREAIETVERVRPHVALVDLGLPVLDGFAVARRVRENEGLNDVVLVALTGYGAESDVRAAREAGFAEHLTKPADLTSIKDVLQRARGV